LTTAQTCLHATSDDSENKIEKEMQLNSRARFLNKRIVWSFWVAQNVNISQS